jgi:hypothetical protein
LGGLFWNLPKGVIFSFYQWEEEKEKDFHFVHCHSDGAKHLFSTIALTINKKAYMLIKDIFALYLLHVLKVSFLACLPQINIAYNPSKLINVTRKFQ